ncbi:hypothetical protein ACTNC4_09485 [Collinsella sp. HCP3S3_B8]|uniref:hypothetical protein n=1 Tax=Collinsella sp. HCP3S3_B8 TaxID=3438933 RepID=UPI003F8C6A90
MADRITWRGSLLSPRTRDALIEAERLAAAMPEFRGWRDGWIIRPGQGSWQPRSPYSGSTHTGDGVVDLSIRHHLTPPQRKAVLRACRQVGFAAWHRMPSRSWVEHHHLVLMPPDQTTNTEGLAASAMVQVSHYRRGLDGLVGKDRDPDPWRPSPLLSWEQYQQRTDTHTTQTSTQEDDMPYTPNQLKAIVTDALAAYDWQPLQKGSSNALVASSRNNNRIWASINSQETLRLVRELAKRQGVVVDEQAIARSVLAGLTPLVRTAVEAAVKAGGTPQAVADAVVSRLGDALKD